LVRFVLSGLILARVFDDVNVRLYRVKQRSKFMADENEILRCAQDDTAAALRMILPNILTLPAAGDR
jgi:hypothetical protein